MAATYMLDTNTFSYIASGASPAARARFRRHSADRDVRMCISALTEAEIRYGMAWKELSPKRCAAINGLLECVDVLAWESSAARMYGPHRAQLRKKGLTVGTMDLLIAVHAASEQAVLVSHDKIFQEIAEFVGIPLPVDWATDIA